MVSFCLTATEQSSHFGSDFYRLPHNADKVTLVKKPWVVPETVTIDGEVFVPFAAGQELEWQIEEIN